MIPISTISKQDRRTPMWFREWLRLGSYDLDAAANESNHVCPVWFGPGGVEEDALSADWSKYKRIFCNPPYARKTKCYPGIAGWLDKGMEAAEHGSTVLFLLPANVGANWFYKFAKHAITDLYSPRIAFETSAGVPMNSPPHASMTMEFAPNTVFGNGAIYSVELPKVLKKMSGKGRFGMKDFEVGEKVKFWVDEYYRPTRESSGVRLVFGEVTWLDASDGSFLVKTSDGGHRYLWFYQPSTRAANRGRCLCFNPNYLRRVGRSEAELRGEIERLMAQIENLREAWPHAEKGES